MNIKIYINNNLKMNKWILINLNCQINWNKIVNKCKINIMMMIIRFNFKIVIRFKNKKIILIKIVRSKWLNAYNW